MVVEIVSNCSPTPSVTQMVPENNSPSSLIILVNSFFHDYRHHVLPQVAFPQLTVGTYIAKIIAGIHHTTED